MELTNDFTVNVPIERAWSVFTDVELIAPCMPGAELQEVAGDEYRGVVKVKVGPITAQYKGAARFQEQDEGARRIVLRAEGRDTRGQGNANATITAQMEPAGDGTAIKVVTDLTVTGKVAQFGRGVLADVSAKLLTQFVECLEKNVLPGAGGSGNPVPAAGNPAPAPAAPSATATAVETAVAPAPSSGNGEAPKAQAEPQVRKVEYTPAEPVNLLDAAGVPVAKRAIPLVAGVLVILFMLRRRRKRRRGRS